MVDIAQEIYSSAKRLQNSGDEMFKLARDYAEAEQEYRKALGMEIIKLKDAKMSVTLIGDIARSNVSNIKFKRDLAEFKYKAGRDKVQALQSELSALQSIYRRQNEI
jgi:ribosome-binding protein aMBF1 (putative translation factor)